MSSIGHQLRSEIIAHLVNIKTLCVVKVCALSNLIYKFCTVLIGFAFRFKRFQDLTVDQFREIRAKAGGLILLLPQNVSKLTVEQRQVS